MGWFANLIFGDPNHDQKADSGAPLPKAVESWQRMSNGEPTPVVPEKSLDAETPAQSGDEMAAMASQEAPPPVTTEPPEVEVQRVEPRLSSDGHHVELWVQLKNLSNVDVEVTRVDCLGQHMQLGRFLKPSEAHEVKIYVGETPKSDALHKCLVMYKATETGKYFEAEHLVRYHYENSEHGQYYVPEDMELLRPIRVL